MAYIYSLIDTWNDGATTFKGIGLNVTDSASAAGSLLMDLQVGGVSQFNVHKNGSFGVFGSAYFVSAVSTALGFVSSSATVLQLNASGLRIRSSASLLWTDNTNAALGTTDLILARDAANTLGQRNGVNAQAFNLYSTYTSATNFQRMAISSARVTLSALTGASATAAALIPDGAVVVGVTARVTTEITGSTGFLIGTAGDTDRWGDITGTAVGTTSDNTNWTAGTIECFTAATDVVITEKTANFTAGAIEIAIHYLRGEAD